MSLLNVILRNRLEIRSIVEKNRCNSPKVFGSVAREEETDSSDIDILVTPEEKTNLFDFARIQLELEELLGRKVDLVNNRTLYGKFRPYIEKELIDI